MKTTLNPEEQRILLGNFSQEERQNVRRSEEWETCFQSWLDSATPSAIAAWLESPEEEFLRWMDAKALQLKTATALSNQEEVEALKEIFPTMQEEDDDRALEEGPVPQALLDRAAALLNRVQA